MKNYNNDFLEHKLLIIRKIKLLIENFLYIIGIYLLYNNKSKYVILKYKITNNVFLFL